MGEGEAPGSAFAPDNRSAAASHSILEKPQPPTGNKPFTPTPSNPTLLKRLEQNKAGEHQGDTKPPQQAESDPEGPVEVTAPDGSTVLAYDHPGSATPEEIETGVVVKKTDESEKLKAENPGGFGTDARRGVVDAYLKDGIAPAQGAIMGVHKPSAKPSDEIPPYAVVEKPKVIK